MNFTPKPPQPPADSPLNCPHCPPFVPLPFMDIRETGWDLEHQYYHSNYTHCRITKRIFQKTFRHYLRTGNYVHPWHLLHPLIKTFDYHITFTVSEKKYPHGKQYAYIKQLLKRLSKSKIFNWEQNKYQFCIEHIHKNCHIHLYVSELTFIRHQQLHNLNRKQGVMIKKLPTQLYINNVLTYINKEEPDKLIPSSIFEIPISPPTPQMTLSW